jgi:hypothetical protein
MNGTQVIGGGDDNGVSANLNNGLGRRLRIS